MNKHFEPTDFFHFNSKKGLPHNWCYDVLEQDPDNFWIANYLGLIKFSFAHNKIQQPLIKVFKASDEKSDALVNSYVLQLEKDQEGKLWVGTFSGISKLINDTKEGIFLNYLSAFRQSDLLSNNSIKKIFRDRQQRLWIGTQKGLNLYDSNRDQFLQFGLNEGLPSEYVLGIAQDEQDFLWIMTTSGIVRTFYDDQKKALSQFEYFTTKEGLTDNINNKNALYIDQKGIVFAGNSKGLNIILNTAPPNTRHPFKLSLTSFAGTQKNKPGFFPIPLTSNTKNLDLAHYENSLQLNYAVLDFTNIPFNYYRHKLLPVNKDWVNTKNNSELTFYNLPNGNYDLILDGCNHAGIWSDDPIKLSININPPFWKSNWAILCYFLFGVGLLRIFYLRRVAKKSKGVKSGSPIKKML